MPAVLDKGPLATSRGRGAESEKQGAKPQMCPQFITMGS